MSNIKFFINLLILLVIQLGILDNIQLHSYVYINIYILAIYILPYRLGNATILFFGFLLGLFVDLASNTMGIHAVATTLLAYIRPRLLMLTANREQIDDIQGKQNISNFSWFFKYILVSTTIFNVVLILCEAFSFNNILITLLRIGCSTIASIFFISLYYFIGVKKKQN
ncbi:MAG: rod shape-determining protein MreD [Odoribacter sp.]